MRFETMDYGIVAGHEIVSSFVLADGTVWNIAAQDERASVILSNFSSASQLQPTAMPLTQPLSGSPEMVRHGRAEWSLHDRMQRLLVLVDTDKMAWASPPVQHDASIICVVGPADDSRFLAWHLVRLSMTIVGHMEAKGGILLHGGLAEWEGSGAILAGPGGVGKTTASLRLRPPWRSWSDDATLVVRDNDGVYWAHPWPTWSEFMCGGSGGSWNVQRAIPLKGIFFLGQAEEDTVALLGGGEAACRLIESAEQSSWPMWRGMDKAEIRAFRLRRLDNACALAQSVPCYLLGISLTGAFWHAMEHVMKGVNP